MSAHYLFELASAAASTVPATGGLRGGSAADERRGSGVGGIFDGAVAALDGRAAVPPSERGVATAAAAGRARRRASWRSVRAARTHRVRTAARNDGRARVVPAARRAGRTQADGWCGPGRRTSRGRFLGRRCTLSARASNASTSILNMLSCKGAVSDSRPLQIERLMDRSSSDQPRTRTKVSSCGAACRPHTAQTPARIAQSMINIIRVQQSIAKLVLDKIADAAAPQLNFAQNSAMGLSPSQDAGRALIEPHQSWYWPGRAQASKTRARE
jgi:hypothetical protein